jgi:hypothetical protein
MLSLPCDGHRASPVCIIGRYAPRGEAASWHVAELLAWLSCRCAACRSQVAHAEAGVLLETQARSFDEMISCLQVHCTVLRRAAHQLLHTSSSSNSSSSGSSSAARRCSCVAPPHHPMYACIGYMYEMHSNDHGRIGAHRVWCAAGARFRGFGTGLLRPGS